jgi:hypothetical protein
MSELKTVTITNISRKERVSSRTGKPFTSLGLQVREYGEKWLSGFDNAATKNWQRGDTVEIEIEQKGDYLNFNVPRKDSSPAQNSGATAELKNILMLKIVPMLEAIHKEQVIIQGRIDHALGTDKEEDFMPHFPGEDEIEKGKPVDFQ